LKLPGLQYTSPVQFTRKQRLQLAVIPPVIAYTLKGLLALNKYEVRNVHHLDDTLAEHEHALLALYHESVSLLAFAYHGRNYHSTASYSFDGELAARMISCFGAETVRGSSSRGGSEALQELQKAIALVPCVGLTIDGPRGPRRGCKPGIAILAARAQVPIIPNAAALTRRKRLKSWDRMPIPLPFGRIVVDFGAPIPPPPDDSPEAVEATRIVVEQACLRLQTMLEEELKDNPDH
jgi:lysophospholipid acyltransferase (LPLAT)-like uncharacterized protein